MIYFARLILSSLKTEAETLDRGVAKLTWNQRASHRLKRAMNSIDLTSNWLFRIFQTLSLLGAVTVSPFAAFFYLAIVAVLLPPGRTFFFPEKEWSFERRALVFVIFIGASGYFLSAGVSWILEVSAAQDNGKATELAFEAPANDIKHFHANREEIVSSIGSAFAAEDFEAVISKSSKYLASEDQLLLEMHDKARAAIDEMNIAMQQKQARERQAIKTKAILAKLKTIPDSDYRERERLYRQLVPYNPYKDEYKERLKYYSTKVQEQREIERIERQKAINERPFATSKFKSLATDMWIAAKVKHFNLFKAPVEFEGGQGVVFGSYTRATYEPNRSLLTKHIDVSWSVQELMKEEMKTGGFGGEAYRKYLKQSVFNAVVAEYCDMSGRYYQYRSRGVLLKLNYNLHSLGGLELIFGEASCQ